MRRSLMLSLASLLLVPAFISCGGDAIPTTAPEAAKEPADILYHLQYLAVRKDYKHVALIAPITPDVVYPSARQLHLVGHPVACVVAPVKDARLAFNSGIYRMTKALTAKTWGKMRHMGISDNSAGRQYGSQAVIKDMALGFDGKKVMTVSCLKKPDGTFGVTLIRWEINPKSLNQE